MNHEDIDYHIRNLLNRVVRNKAYTEDDLKFLESMYHRGWNDLKGELQDLLGIRDDL